jgi:hypothetical protein
VPTAPISGPCTTRTSALKPPPAYPHPTHKQALLQYGFVLGDDPPAMSRSDEPDVDAERVYSSLNEMEHARFDGARGGRAWRRGPRPQVLEPCWPARDAAP